MRDLGKLALQIGGVTETVTITSEVTPVQVADSSRRSTLTQDDIAAIPTKGRDIFGMLGVLPGVQDTNLNRDFTQWRSAISVTINGMPSQNKDVRVDGINIVDEGGCGTAYVNLNMDAVGEVQVIANGYTAENGRNNGGVISMVTKSGTNQLRASGWYNGRRDKFNENDYFRKATNQAKPLYRVNISGYSVGGPVVIPGLVDSRKSGGKKFYFFGSQEFTDDARPTSTTRANMPTGAEYNGDFSADADHQRHDSADHRPAHRPAVPGQPDSGRGHAGMRRAVQLHRPARSAHAADPAGSQQHPESAGRSGVDVELGVRPDAGARPDEQRPARRHGLHREDPHGDSRFVKDRDDDWSWNRLTPGTGFVNQNTPGLLIATTVSQVLQADVVNEIGFGYTHNRWGFTAADDFDYTSLYRSDAQRRSAAVRAVRATTRIRRTISRHRRAGRRVAVCAAIRHVGRQSVRRWPDSVSRTSRFPA